MIPDITSIAPAISAPPLAGTGGLEAFRAPDPATIAHFQSLMSAAGIGSSQTVLAQSTVAGPADSVTAMRGPAMPSVGGPEVGPTNATGHWYGDAPPVGPTYGSVGAPQVAGPDQPNLGESILSGMQSMSDAYNTRMQDISARLRDSSVNMFSIKETLQLQYDLTQINIQQDMAAKIADKTSQGLQTLFKNQ